MWSSPVPRKSGTVAQTPVKPKHTDLQIFPPVPFPLFSNPVLTSNQFLNPWMDGRETTMGIHNLDKIFHPEAVAVVGASPRIGTVGYAFVDNLLKGGFKGKIFPVNPHHVEILGLKAYPSLADIHQPVDLAIVSTPIHTAPAIIQECADVNIMGAIIVSAGGKEAGAEGREIESRIKTVADKAGIRIVGPNCLGVVSAESKLNATFASHMPLPGKLAFISQSGAICTAILDLSLKEKNGFSYFVSIGSMLDVDFGDLVNYLGNDNNVSSIVLYIESLTHFRKFMSAARAVSRIKPIVVLKAGRSAAGARAAASHTGALAGSDAVYDAAFVRAGIVRVNNIEELFDCAELMAKQPRPQGSGMAIITNAGGPGVMAADALASYGMEPVTLSSDTMQKLNSILPPYWSRGNPIDILGDASPDRYRKVLEVCIASPEIRTLLIIMTPQSMSDPTGVAESLSELLRGKGLSVFTVWMGGLDMEKGRSIFNAAGIPTYDTPERAIRAFQYMCAYARNMEMLQQIPQKLPEEPEFDQTSARTIITEALEQDHHLLTEVESKALLSAYGIPVNPTKVAISAEEAVRIAREMGYPVVMKIHSRDITHKSDAKGVQLNLKYDEDIREAYAAIMTHAAEYNPQAELLGVTVQTMLQRQDYELILGSKKDADFGPVILFGMGGIMTEVLKDQAIALPPLNRLLARRLMESTRVYNLLKGYRNRPPANLDLLDEILVRLSQLVIDFPEITELDINPLLITENGACAVDARVCVEPSSVPSPMHLVISPYPSQYETSTVLKNGETILIRPIKPEDAPLLMDLFNSLSSKTIYFRFFRPLKSLAREMLVRFTQIDYDRDIVFVALHRRDGDERILGVVRLMGDPDVTKAEFAVVVSDSWQGKGVGAALLQQSISVAKEHGLKFIWGHVLPENTNMLALGRKLGFIVKRIPGSSNYELRIDLSKT